MFTQRRWIILLFPILGSCEKPSTTSPNRAIGCTDKTLCWDDHHHLCLPCEIKNNHQDNHHEDHHDTKHEKQHFIQYQPIVGSGKKLNRPPKIGGRDSLPSAKRSPENRVFPYPTNKDWTEDKTVAQNRIMSEDKPTKINRQQSPGDECEAKKGWCYLYLTGKCIACKEYVLEFAIALDKRMATNSGKQ